MMGTNLSLKIIDTLARNLGKPLSIQALTKEMSTKKKKEFYANVYNQVKELNKNNILKITKAGKSNLLELNFDSANLQPTLMEMELLNTNKLFDNPQLSSIRKSLDALFYDTPFIGAACITKDSQLFALNKIELLFLLRPPSPSDAEHERAILNEQIKSIEANANTKIDFLALTSDEFIDSLYSKELNPVKNLLKKEVAIFNPGFYWMTINQGQKKNLKFENIYETADPRKLNRDDIILAYERHGYRELGTTSILSPNYSIETAIAAALILQDARLIEATPVIFAKDEKQKINYPLIEFLAKKYGKLNLLGFLLETALDESKTLKENTKAKKCLERIRNAVPKTQGQDPWQINLAIRKEDIKDKMRLYHAH